MLHLRNGVSSKNLFQIVFNPGFADLSTLQKMRGWKSSKSFVMGLFQSFFYTEEGDKSCASSFPGVCTVVKKTVAAPDENSMVHNAKAYLMRNKLKKPTERSLQRVPIRSSQSNRTLLLGIFGRLCG